MSETQHLNLTSLLCLISKGRDDHSIPALFSHFARLNFNETITLILMLESPKSNQLSALKIQTFLRLFDLKLWYLNLDIN